jgi:hypothetical protein
MSCSCLLLEGTLFGQLSFHVFEFLISANNNIRIRRKIEQAGSSTIPDLIEYQFDGFQAREMFIVRSYEASYHLIGTAI